jgi:hypothetical protein
LVGVRRLVQAENRYEVIRVTFRFIEIRSGNFDGISEVKDRNGLLMLLSDGYQHDLGYLGIGLNDPQFPTGGYAVVPLTIIENDPPKSIT